MALHKPPATRFAALEYPALRAAIFSVKYGPGENGFLLLTGKQARAPRAYVSGVATGDFPDPRLNRLAGVCSSSKITPDRVEFHCFVGTGSMWSDDKAGEIFAHLKTYDALIMTVDNGREAEDLISRLVLTDLEALERAEPKMKKLVAAGVEPQEKLQLIKDMASHLELGKPLSEMRLTKEQKNLMAGYGLITLKPSVLVLPTGDVPGFNTVNADIGLALELAQADPEEAEEMRRELAIEDPIPGIFKALYRAAGLIHFFTLGPKEAREWPVRQGALAPEAAGKIHSDMRDRFIRALVADWKDVIEAGGWEAAKKAGVARTQGKNYQVQDGDVLEILF